jgi:plasmid stabilization system protein ParE
MRIRWTTPAARDLTGISDYIGKRDGPVLARRVHLRCMNASIRWLPSLGRDVLGGFPTLANL